MADALGYSRYQSVSDIETARQDPSETVLRLLDMLDMHGDPVDRRQAESEVSND